MASNTMSDRNTGTKIPEVKHYYIVRNLIDAAQAGDERRVASIIVSCSNFQKQILDTRNDWGYTALHHAAEGGHLGVVKVLVCARASATILNNQGETCLHRATFAKQTAVVSYLASKCPDAIDVPSDAGATALHYAAKYGYYYIANHLILNDASLDKENNIGETPLAVAERYRNTEVYTLLQKEQERREDTGVLEINFLETDVVEAYQKAIKYCLKPEHRFLIRIVGVHGCGKTNLKYALTGDFHLQKSNTPPTQGIAADPSVCRIKSKQYKDWICEPSPNANKSLAMKRVKLDYTDRVIWQMLSDLKCRRKLIQKKKFLRSYTATQQIQDPPSDKDAKFLDSLSSSTSNLQPERESIIPTPTPTTPPPPPSELPDTSNAAKEQQMTFSPYLQDSITDIRILYRLHFRWADEVFQNTPYSNEADYLSLNFWDFSGDPKFRIFVPFFFSGRSGYIVTYNAAELFTEHNQLQAPGVVTQTEENLLYWLSLISCMFSHSSVSLDALVPARAESKWTPAVIIVGTHSDKLIDQTSKKLVKFLVLDIVYRHKKKFSFYMCDPMYSFLLDTTEGDLFMDEVSEGKLEPLHFLRRDIENLAFAIPLLRQPIPLHWSLFERIIYQLREQKQGVHSLQSVMLCISADARICDPMEVIPMLSYFHDIGMILFYARHPILRQYLVPDPQFLVDLVANLFNPTRNFTDAPSKEAKAQLSLTGQLTYKYRTHAWLDVSLSEESEQYVMEILEAMNIIAQPNRWKSSTHYAPSCVDRAPPPKFLTDLWESTSRISPLYFIFQHVQLLRSLFTYLVCACIKEGMRNPILYSDVTYIRFETFTLCLFLDREAIGFSLILKSIDFFAPSKEDVSNSPSIVNPDLEETGFSKLNNLLYGIGCSLCIPLGMTNLNEKCRFVRNALENQLKQILKLWFPSLKYWLCYTNEGTGNALFEDFVKLGRGRRILNNAPESVKIWF